MYKLVVGEISKARKAKWALKNTNPYSVWDGDALATEDCRISALSSADYCLRDRVEVDWGRIAWKGNRQEIRRLFEAERLDSKGLEALDSRKDYAVLFLELYSAGCA